MIPSESKNAGGTKSIITEASTLHRSRMSMSYGAARPMMILRGTICEGAFTGYDRNRWSRS